MFRRLTKLTASFISISALLISSASFLAVSAPQNAEACRDCPFPMHLSNGHWLMPSGMSELLVEEINLGGGKVQTVVKLFDSLKRMEKDLSSDDEVPVVGVIRTNETDRKERLNRQAHKAMRKEILQKEEVKKNTLADILKLKSEIAEVTNDFRVCGASPGRRL